MKLVFKKFGSGCPLIILHGLYGSGDNWYSIGKALSQNFEVYLVDLRNHGSSPHHPDMNFDLMTSDIEEFFIDEKLEKVCILGHSMGGKIAMNFTLNNPNKVVKLVIVDVALRSYTTTGDYSQEANTHRKIVDSLAKLDISGSRSRKDIDLELSQYITQKPLRDFLLKNLDRQKSGEFSWTLNIESLNNNLTNLLEGINPGKRIFGGPVLLITGKQSIYVTAEDYVQFRNVFPQIRIEEFDTGHWVHAEQPEKIINLLVEFL
jgi:esterase